MTVYVEFILCFRYLLFVLANPHCQARGGLGDCSTICIPTETGRVCACEDGVSLKPDKRTCENSKKYILSYYFKFISF